MSNSIGNEQDLRLIKSLVAFEFCIAAVVIVCGGLVYGVESGRWGQALIYSGGLFAGAAVTMGMLYQRALQRCKVFSR